jgi:hypothetical protein
MKITENTTTILQTKDSAGCFWLFGFFFIVVAGFFVIGLMGAFNNLNELNQLEQAAAWVIALSGVAAGIWIIYSNPAIRVSFDKRENSVTIIRRSLMRNETENYPLNEIINIEIKESKDDEGDPIFSVEMKLKRGRSASLTKTWLRNKEDLLKLVDEINDFL